MFKNVINNSLLRLCCALIIFIATTPLNSTAADSFIEITHSSGNDTFDGISSIGFYANFTEAFSIVSYGGIQITLFKDPNTSAEESVVRIFAGNAIKGTISPFFEVGTDAYGFLVLLSDNDNRGSCKDDQECALDAYFRFGVRFNLSKELSFGVYHENTEFGDSHTHLKGSHSYTGASLGINF